jgi:hypothetical protein
MLCLADRGFAGYARWQQAAATGAQLLRRAKSNAQLPVLQRLPDGSFLSALYPDETSHRNARKGIAVRVIEYSLTAVKVALGQQSTPGQPQRYRLLSSLLDPAQAPALELALRYHERWEVEAAFDELKTHLANGKRTLRSKTAEGVRQEFYGWVLAHYAVCWLMHQTASEHRLHQGVLSFTAHANLLRRVFPRSGEFPPQRPRLRKRWFTQLLKETSKLRCVSSRGKARARMKKHKHTNYLFYKKSRAGSHTQDLTIVLLGPLALSAFYSSKRARKKSK